jgi:hypothetical protein
MHSPRFELPPGPSFVIRHLLSLKFAGYVALVCCIRFGGGFLNVHVPFWAIVSSSVAALPAIIYAKSEFQYWRYKRKAESLGARLAPVLSYKWPAGIDLVLLTNEIFKTGYLGECNALGASCVRVLQSIIRRWVG